MPGTCPKREDLIKAVCEFLKQEVLPKVDGRLAFNARVAINVLGIVQRELSLGDAADDAERKGLAKLLGRDGSREDLNRMLCEQLRVGEQDVSAPAVREHLHRTTMAKLAIDNPRYASYRRALEGTPNSDRDSSLD